jgi:small subunit ribosomal protein S15
MSWFRLTHVGGQNMARMHSRDKGKSGSVRTLKNEPSKWVSYSKDEIEALVEKIAKTEKTASQIGIELRDQYGIPSVKEHTGKSIKNILTEKKLTPEIPDDLMDLIKKEINILKHQDKNHKDQPANRGLILTNSKIRRLVKYYKRVGILSKTWTYNREKARLIVG